MIGFGIGLVIGLVGGAWLTVRYLTGTWAWWKLG